MLFGMLYRIEKNEGDRHPTKAQVDRWLKEEGWGTSTSPNTSAASSGVGQKKPGDKADRPHDHSFQAHVVSKAKVVMGEEQGQSPSANKNHGS